MNPFDQVSEPDSPPPAGGGRRGLVAWAILTAALLALVVYAGFSRFGSRPRPQAVGFEDAEEPEYRPAEYALVAEIYDGDTVRLADGRRVRYLGIDTPETAKPFLGVPVGDPFAEEAAEFNRALVLDREVGLVYGIERTDHYGRTLACLIVSDPETGENLCVNVELLRRGLARAYIVNRDFRYRKWFLKVQDEARRRGLGIWSLPKR